MNKKIRKSRLNRKNRVRRRLLSRSSLPRLIIDRSIRNISAQVIAPNGKVICSATSTKKDFKRGESKIAQAEIVGKDVAKKLDKAKIKAVVLDRGYYRYHGRVKALVEAVRQSGIKI
jgi:large subunit ribosomal protein L18